tara:strand:- start:121 stop:957 length:837 start_codon:yes stop_codon:yes gene_type:complete
MGKEAEDTKMRLLNKNNYIIDRDYHIDFSDAFIDKTSELKRAFEAGEYKSIHILGNSPGLSKVPDYIFKDDKILKIGLNRAFLQGVCDILLWTDKLSIESIRKRIPSSHLSKTMIVKVGGEDGVSNKIEGYRRVTYRDFTTYYMDSINCKNEEIFSHWPYPCLMMAKTVLTSALHLVYNILQDARDIPIIIDGVSMDKRNYFYDKSINSTRHQPNQPYSKGAGRSLRTFKVTSNSIKMTHSSVITDIITDMISAGFNISYTDDSDMLSKIKGLTCLQY